jgi:hypothetical protein
LPQESYQYKWPLSHFLEKFGVQLVLPESLATHWPETLQDSLARQEPQFTVPPQLLFQTPHNLPSDEHVAGTHEETHWPEALQVWPEAQAPQEPLQPSEPQTLPEQLGVHDATHWPEALQVWPEAQAPQKSQPPHWSAMMPHCFPCAEQLLQAPEHREAVSSISPGALNGNAAAQ